MEVQKRIGNKLRTETTRSWMACATSSESESARLKGYRGQLHGTPVAPQCLNSNKVRGKRNRA